MTRRACCQLQALHPAQEGLTQLAGLAAVRQAGFALKALIAKAARGTAAGPMAIAVGQALSSFFLFLFLFRSLVQQTLSLCVCTWKELASRR